MEENIESRNGNFWRDHVNVIQSDQIYERNTRKRFMMLSSSSSDILNSNQDVLQIFRMPSFHNWRARKLDWTTRPCWIC